jgi:hypothetical protein
MTQIERVKCAALATLSLGLVALPSSAQTNRVAESPSASVIAGKQHATADDKAIRPFRIKVPEETLTDFGRRLAATRWPDKETVTDRSQGVQLATLKDLMNYWQTTYDWRKAEARLNALPQFMTTIDGVDIHFIHVRSRNPNAMPLIMTHGWPGSIFELLKTVGPLTDPTGLWRTGGRRLRSRTAVDAWLRLLGHTAGHGLRSGAHRPRVGRIDEASGIRALCRVGRRLGFGHRGRDGASGASGADPYSRQYAGDRAA